MVKKKIIYLGLIGLLSIQTNIIAQEPLVNTPSSKASISKNIEIQNARNAVMALNHMHESLNKIVLYNDQIILEDEYDSIINNINLTVIDDKELVDLVMRLMDTLSAFKLSELEKKEFEAKYEEDLNDALKTTLIGSGNTIIAMNPVEVVLNTRNAYMDYQQAIDSAKEELDKSQWQLKKDAISELNVIRKEFLITYWKLMKKYNMPDEWRITEKQLTRLVTILKENDENKKFRQLERLRNEFAVSPTYWYELSLAAHRINNKEAALDALIQYESLDDQLLRHNAQYGLMLSNKASYLDPLTQKNEIRSILEEIHEIDPVNSKGKLFLAMEYGLIGDTKMAESLLNENIDDNFLPDISRKLKLDLYVQEKDLGNYEATIKELLEQQNLSVIEYLNYLGKQPVEILAKEIDKAIKEITIKINKSLYGKDSLLIFLPKKWILHNVKDMSLKVVMDEKEYETSDVSKTDEMIIYAYKDIVPYSDIKERNIKSINLKMINNELPVTISYNIEIIKPSTEKAEEEKEDSNTSSFLDTSISGLYNNSVQAYNKGVEIYSDLRSEIQFVPTELNINNKCFDIENKLKSCK